jgi:hypothetical protein
VTECRNIETIYEDAYYNIFHQSLKCVQRKFRYSSHSYSCINLCWQNVRAYNAGIYNSSTQIDGKLLLLNVRMNLMRNCYDHMCSLECWSNLEQSIMWCTYTRMYHCETTLMCYICYSHAIKLDKFPLSRVHVKQIMGTKWVDL